jgi:hypothetical protein
MFTNCPHEGITFKFCLGNAIPFQEPMVFVENLKYGIHFPLGFGMAMQYPSKILIICYGTKGIIIYPNIGTTNTPPIA